MEQNWILPHLGHSESTLFLLKNNAELAGNCLLHITDLNRFYFRSVEKGRSIIPESRMAFFFLLEIWLFREGHFSIFILCWNYLGNFSDIQQKVTSCSPARMIKIKIKKKLQQTVNGRIVFYRHFTTTCCFWIFCWLSKESVRKTCQQNKMFYLSITRVHLLSSIS